MSVERVGTVGVAGDTQIEIERERDGRGEINRE